MPILKKVSKTSLYLVLSISLLLNSLLLIFNNKSTDKRDISINVLETYELSEELTNYREPNIVSTPIPNKSPFGGFDLGHTRITADYLSREYKENFGDNHYALDIVPTDTYYNNIPIFLSRNRALVFATHSGTARYLLDEFGANYLIITNQEETHRTMYVHLEASYVNTDEEIEAGQIIGVMGTTGKSTAPHLHYAVQVKNDFENWVYVNPREYIE